MKDQALRLREIVEQRREDPRLVRPPNLVGLTLSPRTIAVTSGKGGVGKTNLTINMGITLALRGKSVAILDADLGLANVNVALGLKVRSNLMDVIIGRKRIEEVVVEGPGGVWIIPGASGVAELADIDDVQRNRLVESFTRLARKVDILLIDTAAGISKNVLSFALLADQVIVVTVPEPTAIADAYGMIKSLIKANPAVNIKLVVNRVLSRFEGKAVHDKISLVVRRFLSSNIESIGTIREDSLVGESVRQQKPISLEYPDSTTSKDISALLPHLFDEYSDQNGLVTGFLDRLKRWFA